MRNRTVPKESKLWYTLASTYLSLKNIKFLFLHQLMVIRAIKQIVISIIYVYHKVHEIIACRLITASDVALSHKHLDCCENAEYGMIIPDKYRIFWYKPVFNVTTVSSAITQMRKLGINVWIDAIWMSKVIGRFFVKKWEKNWFLNIDKNCIRMINQRM